MKNRLALKVWLCINIFSILAIISYKMHRKSLWNFMCSLFYINFINTIFILDLLLLIVTLVICAEEMDNYRNFQKNFEQMPCNGKLNIAMFTNNYFPFIGGVPVSIERLAKGLKKQGHQVYIFAPKYPFSCPDENSNIIRCRLLFYYKTRTFNFPIINIFSPKIEKEFVSRKIDVVHVHHPFWMGSKGVKLAKKYKVPVVFTYHTRLDKYSHYVPALGRELFKNKVSHYMVRKFSKKCDAVFAPTNTAKEYLKNIGVRKNIEILPTGIDFKDYNSIEIRDIEELKQKYKKNNEIILSSVSRLAKEKNLYFLLEGVKHIKEHTSLPFKLIIIGEGPERENLLKAIESDNLKDMVLLIGAVSPKDIYKYYMFSDIFVFASQSETQGIVLIEAMAGKCPVVAVCSSGIDDIIFNEYNGFKTKADIQAWAEKVLYLMENPEKLMEMAQNAYNFSKSFSIEQMAKNASELYFRTIEKERLMSAAKGDKRG